LTKKKENKKVIRGRKVINSIEISEDINIIWKQKFKSYITLDFSDPLMKQKLVAFTNRVAERTSQQEKEHEMTQNNFESSIGPQFKEMMVVVDATNSKERKIKSSLEK
jgi:hypothetical protein